MRSIVICVLICCNYICVCEEASRDVLVRLTSDWPRHEFAALMETSEFLPESDYWNFVDKVTHKNPQTAMEAFDLAINASGLGDAILRVHLLKMSLQLRAMSPAIEQQRVAAYSLFRHASVGDQQCQSDFTTDILVSPPKTWIAVFEKNKPNTVQSYAFDTPVQKLLPKTESEGCESTDTSAEIWKWDHVFQKNGPSQLVIILHGVLGTEEFAQAHRRLKAFAEEAPGTSYIVRYMPLLQNDEQVKNATALQGYGVTLDIKNTEYLTVDNDKAEDTGKNNEKQDLDLTVPFGGLHFDKVAIQFPKSVDKIKALHAEFAADYAEDTSLELPHIPVWELSDLGLQATSRILSSSDPITRMEDLILNFPSRARQILKLKVQPGLRASVEQAHLMRIPTGRFLLNGLSIDVTDESFNIFRLLKQIDEEVLLAKSLDAAKINTQAIQQLSQLLLETEDNKMGITPQEHFQSVLKTSGIRVNVKHQAKGSIFFLNNLEKDAPYKNWPDEYRYLLQRSNQLLPIRKNIYTVILVLDVENPEDLQKLAIVLYLMDNGTPIRVGVVFAPSKNNDRENLNQLVVALYNLAMKNRSRSDASAFLHKIAAAADSPKLSRDDVFQSFAEGISEATSGELYDTLMEMAQDAQSDKKSDSIYNAMQKYREDLGLPVSSWSVNGKIGFFGEDFDDKFQRSLFEEQQLLQMAVHFGIIQSNQNVLNIVLQNAIARYHTHIFRSPADSTYMTIPLDTRLSNVQYMYESEGAEHVVTIWLLVREISNEDSRRRIDAALRYIATKPENVRVAILPTTTTISCGNTWNALLQEKKLAPASVACENTPLETVSHVDLLDGIEMGTSPLILMCNGRVFDLSSDMLMEPGDFAALVKHEMEKRVPNIARFVKTEMQDSLELGISNVILTTSAAAGIISKGQRTVLLPDDIYLKDLTIQIPSPEKRNLLNIQVAINPLHPVSQRIVPIVAYLHRELGARVEVLLLPEISVSTFPIASYFRFVTNADAMAIFERLPQKQLLTLKISTPEPWIVYPKDTRGVDTDNILLQNLKHDAVVEFQLKSLLVTGHCIDMTNQVTPAGLQFELQYGKHVVDSLVMQNLGYLQLQANPAVWMLSLAPGNSDMIYEIMAIRPVETQENEMGGDEENANENGKARIVIRDFTGYAQEIQVRKREGMEHLNLLDVQHGNAGSVETKAAQGFLPSMWQMLQSWFFSSTTPVVESQINANKQAATPHSDLDTIHVFSLASGALYERFLRIMTVSVTKATKNPVKFWFIENFLSPEFKGTIEKLAKEYHFEYSLITYKWPHWLRRQTEKQRIIWGYKILFLDVLFPLDVKKIIYVDSDQVVRADLRELWDMDLKGHAYGYTPFCDSRKETLGFQFWRSGYWKDHLQGRPYHISALYVVDLVQFRKRVVGDKLRAIYDRLSRDENSLSNLDQDLPNFAQLQVPIFSLPQQWLWCESWCSDESKKEAKTIDLCNNPLHKEPKLDMAKRVISGDLFPQSWVELDEEIKNVIAVKV